MNELQSTFLILSASFPSTSCCFSSGMSLKIVSLHLQASCLCCCVHSRNWKLQTGRFWQCFSRLLSRHFPPCLDHMLQCITSGVHCFMYHDQDTFDFSWVKVQEYNKMLFDALASWWILPITFKIKKCEWTTVQPWFNDEPKDWPNFVCHNEILLHWGSVPLFYNNWGREQCLLYQGFHHNYRGSLYQRSTVMPVVCLSKKFFYHRSSHCFEYPKKTRHSLKVLVY